MPSYENDMIARMLAGVAPAGRPLFLKMVYHGPKAMEELVRYDPHLVVGILGGSAGTTRDAFQLLYDAQKFGAKVALFGARSTTPKTSWRSCISFGSSSKVSSAPPRPCAPITPCSASWEFDRTDRSKTTFN